MKDKNYIYNELKGIGGEGLQSENNLFKELLEFEIQENRKVLPSQNRVIEFHKFDESYDANSQIPMKLAAESGIGQKSSKSEFLISGDGKYIIKYSKRSKEEMCLTLLSEDNFVVDDVILYSPELNRYFVSNASNDFIICQYSAISLDKITFNAILPFDEIDVIKKGNSYIALSLTGYSYPEISAIKSSCLILKPNISHVFRHAVLINNKSKDFLEINGLEIEIPLMLLSEKNRISLY